MASKLIKPERIRGSTSLSRRELVVQAAIEVLAQHGSRGLTHRRVDGHLGWPMGSTANFFPRRDDVLIAVAQYIVQADAVDLALERSFPGPDGVSQAQFTGRIVRLLEKWLSARYRHRLMAGAEVLLESRRNPHVLQAVRAQLGINENWYRQIFEQLGSLDPIVSARLFTFSMSSFYMGTCVATHLPNKPQLGELVSGWVSTSLAQHAAVVTTGLAPAVSQFGPAPLSQDTADPGL